MRAVLARAAGLALVTIFAGCESEPVAPVPPPPPAPTRSYAVGWAPTAPRPETQLIIDLIDSLRVVSDVTILHQEPPWEALLAGAPMDSLLDDVGDLADFLRVKGLDIVFLVDPLDGLNRLLEPPALVAAGRSILEPQIRGMHEDWVRAVTTRIRPEWMGLASEINTTAELGNPALYAELVDMVNTLAPQVRTLSPETQVFVSFQVDQANGFTPGGTAIDHFALIDDFDIDALGLSSYPVFVFDSPADVPDNYFATFDAATDLPLIFVEGGWGSSAVPASNSTPQEQVEWFERFEGLLDGVGAELWVMLTFTDLEIPTLGLPPERALSLSNFASMGILDTNLARKPAYDTWQRIFERPLAP